MHPARQRRSAPPHGSRAAAHRAARGRRSPGRRGRRGRRSTGLLVGLLVVLGLMVPAAYFLGGARSDASSGTPAPQPTTTTPAHRPTPTSSAPSVPASPSTSPSTSSSPRSSRIKVPTKGSGTFTTARATGKKVGRGARPLRYVVQVETGLDVSPSRAAKEIDGILAAPRGWTHNPGIAFQLVGAGAPHDITIKIATPTTADALCWAGIRQDTGGEYNCEVPGGVVVNLRRWAEGSHTFTGPIHDYRALIINHEMGHFLGHSHQTCGGVGRPAPVMMQQIKGLHGCVPNAWPYDTHGNLITGPPA
ncbi:DUF3152 domain-containing protein [Streptomyces sp. B3I8]|uniref:DUF3152 domain-containing protein n=1 Tax=Streptomyces sp. B3I8 TaxID=3042303 RepID=UPI0027868A6F|nr:DUF3152 domain-containing protein [Streptomyces sp. B3I8]MDQ0788199.1 hypothetical protein [Streptomyces sp. B3I8]